MSANDDDDIAATLAGLDQPHATSAAPVNDDEDIAHTMAGLDVPSDAHKSAPKAARQPVVDLSKMSYADKVSHYESGGNQNAKNPTSSATGSGQFVDNTWLPLIKKHRPELAAGKSDADILAMRKDPQLSKQMIDAYASDNAGKLSAANIPVTDASKYGAHWFGPEAFEKIYKSDPKTPIESVIGHEAAANNGLAGKTTGGVKDLVAGRQNSDYLPKDLSWGDTLSQAASNFIPSAGNAVKGIYHAIRHPGDTADVMGEIGKGALSKVDGYMGDEQDPEKKAKDEALLDSIGHEYKKNYGSVEGFKHHLATDPAGVAMDASTALMPAEGVLGKAGSLVGKVSAGAGDALATTGKVAGTVGRAINPLNPLGVVSKAGEMIGGATNVLDKSGNIVPKADKLIQKVTSGTMKASDIVDPDAKAAFAATIAKKGLSEDSVREGLLASQGLKTPTQAVTGKAGPVAGREATQAAIDENNAKLTEKAGKLGSGSNSDIAASLDKAHTDSLNAASDTYDKIRNLPGSFGPLQPANGSLGALGGTIKRSLTTSGIPTADLKTIADTGHGQTAAAIKLLQSNWGSGKSLMNGMGGQVDSREIMAMRKALNNLKANARGADIKGMNDVIDSFDTHLQNESAAGKFKDTSGQPVYGLGQQIKAANTAYRQHFQTFENSNAGANPLASAVKKLKSEQQYDPASGHYAPSGNDAHYAAVQDSLNKQLLHPVKGEATYNRLAGALGSTQPVDDFVKSQVLGGKKPPDWNSPVIKKAFASDPDSLSRAKHIQAAMDINNAKPSGVMGQSIKGALGSMAGKAAAAGLGYETMGPLGVIAGPLMEHGVEAWKDSRAARNATAGAASAGLPTKIAKGVIRNATRPTSIAAAHYKDEAQKVEDRQGHAAGGKVDHIETLLNKLITRWKSAKKATDETTKPLLKVPDAAIVKALSVAQESI